MKTTIKAFFLIGLISTLAACSNQNKLSSSDKRKAASYHSQLGAGYLKNGRLALSKEHLERALKQDPRSVDAHHFYALLQEKLGDNQKATYFFQKAVRLDKRKSSALLNNYGSHLCKVGKYTTAVNAFESAIKDPLYETPEFAYTNAGVCLKKQGNMAKASQYFQQALTKNKNFPLALYQLAQLNHEQGEQAKAQAFLYRYNERAADTPETLLLCYKIHKALGEEHQARVCEVKLQSRFPTSKEVNQLN